MLFVLPRPVSLYSQLVTARAMILPSRSHHPVYLLKSSFLLVVISFFSFFLLFIHVPSWRGAHLFVLWHVFDAGGLKKGDLDHASDNCNASCGA